MKILKTYFTILFQIEQLNVITNNTSMNDKVNKRQIKKRSKLTKIYFKHGKNENDLGGAYMRNNVPATARSNECLG